MKPTRLRSAAIAAIAALTLILSPLPTRSQQGKDVRVVAIEGEQRAGGDKWAILIGVNDYIDPGIADLKYAVQDVEAVHRVLENSGQFAGIKLMTDWATTMDLKPTRNNILSAIKTLALSIAQPNDTIVIYISAHGITESGKNFLLPQDAKLGLLADTAVSLDRIYDYLNESQSKAQVVILDACHSGARKDRAGETLEEEFVFSAEGRITLASSGISESSFEWDDKQHGVFSYYVVEGLAGDADSNGDGFVTAMETSTYVTSGVRKWAFDNSKAQNPRILSNISGDIVLTRIREQTKPEPDIARHDHPVPVQPDTRPELDRVTTGGVFLTVEDEWGETIDDYVVEMAGSRVSASPGQPVSDLKKGSHTLTVKARGYYDKAVDVYIDPGTVRSEDVVLRRLRGKIEVTSQPAGADVIINGDLAGKTNDVFGDLIDGRKYRVKVRKEGYSPSEDKTVTIVGERTTDLAFALLSLPTLEVIANVEGFTLLVDGTDKGKASGQTKKITVDEPKTVSIKIQKEGYQDWSKSGIGLKAGATERVTAEMIRRNLLHVTAKVTGGSPSDADGVEIVVDGKSRGRLSGGEMKVWDLSSGTHDVVIKTGKKDIEKNAYVPKGQTAMIELEFERGDLGPGGMASNVIDGRLESEAYSAQPTCTKCIVISSCSDYDKGEGCIPVRMIDTSAKGADGKFKSSGVVGYQVFLIDANNNMNIAVGLTDVNGNYKLIVSNDDGSINMSNKFNIVLKVPEAKKSGVPCSLGFSGNDCYIVLDKEVMVKDDGKCNKVPGINLPSPGGGRAEVGNADCSAAIDVGDLMILKSSFGSSVGADNYQPYADFDGNGTVDVEDFLILKKNYGKVLDDAPAFVSNLCKP